MFKMLNLVEGFMSVEDVHEGTGFPLGGGNDKGVDFFLFLSFFLFFVIPAKAGIQFFISVVNYEAI